MKTKYRIKVIIALILLIGFIVVYFFFKDEKVSLLKEYSPSGKLIGTNEYVIRSGDTIMHGKFVNYNERGVRISEGQFIDNEPFGVCSYYDEEGKIEAVFFRKNSKINLECKYYNQTGLIEKYIMCDDFGRTAFTICFDAKGVTKYNGYLQIETYQYKFANKAKFNFNEDQNLKIGDTLIYRYIVANIPNAKRTFTIENVGSDNLKVKRFIKKVEPCQIDVKEILTKKGKNTIRSIVKYEFYDKVTPVLIDTLTFEVDVKR
ncbi:hypothetical protein [Flavobacterium sp.]|uniref:hypothetical protein n=1 Tax=Flavobacterium sp. TaxID=239 RepID=UPI003B9C95AF